MLKIEFCELTFEKISKFSFMENFGSETKIRKFPHCATKARCHSFSREIISFGYTLKYNVFTEYLSIKMIWSKITSFHSHL